MWHLETEETDERVCRAGMEADMENGRVGAGAWGAWGSELGGRGTGTHPGGVGTDGSGEAAAQHGVARLCDDRGRGGSGGRYMCACSGFSSLCRQTHTYCKQLYRK